MAQPMYIVTKKAVYKNVAVQSLVLSKKMHSISYHFCCEAVAGGVCRVAKEDLVTNLADLFTKVLPRVKEEDLIDRFMYCYMVHGTRCEFSPGIGFSHSPGQVTYDLNVYI